MEKTKIQWTDHTWNIAVGCSKVDEDCKFCYMYRGSMNNTRYDPKVVRKTKTVFNLPLKIKEPSRIFVSSLTDAFHPEIDSFRDEMWEIIRKCPQHTFQILTKRPERIADHLPEDWGNGWDNVWLGTSIGSMKGMIRYQHLFSFPVKVRFISIEPLYEDVMYIPAPSILTIDVDQIPNFDDFIKEWQNLGGPIVYKSENEINSINEIKAFHGIDWVIIGGESGNETGKYRYRPCNLEWIQKIVHACKESSIPVFVKQLGTHLSKEMGLKDRHGGDITEWPENIQVREFPIDKLRSNDFGLYYSEE